jgi:hypothetical protein
MVRFVLKNQVTSSRVERGGALQRLKTLAGVDIHIFTTVLFRSWGILAGAVTLLLLPLWLSPAQQGYYYTFASLLALQVFFELGLSQVIIQLVGHEAAHLRFHDNGTVSGASDRLARLSGIVALLRRWYAIAAMLFFVLGGVAGALFFGCQGDALPIAQWAPAWVVVVALTAVNLYFSPQLAVVEGAGHVGQVARLRLFQSMVGYGALWILLITGANLWATVAVPFVSACATLLWLRARAGWLSTRLAGTSTINWRRDVFPMQWRIAVSFACGYLIFSLFTPVVFSIHGAAEAGRLGMAMSVFSAVTTLGLSWINAKTPSFAMHVSRGESAALNDLFRGVAIRSTAVTALMGFTIVGLAALGSHMGIGAVQRIASPTTLLWIACAATVNTAVYAAAVYMRAHREEPMLPVSIVSALLTVGMVTLLRNDVSRMMLGYAAISACVALPWTFLLLRRYRARHDTTLR